MQPFKVSSVLVHLVRGS